MCKGLTQLKQSFKIKNFKANIIIIQRMLKNLFIKIFLIRSFQINNFQKTHHTKIKLHLIMLRKINKKMCISHMHKI